MTDEHNRAGTAFALMQCVVWTAAAIKAYTPAPVIETAPEITAARYAQRFLEVWLLRWGPAFAGDAYQSILEQLHRDMPPEDWISKPTKPPRAGRPCPTCGHSAR